jgi:hypothetical protein
VGYDGTLSQYSSNKEKIMETNLYFSVLVLTTCALHLGWTASGWLNGWWKKNVAASKKPAARPADSDGLLSRKPARQRSDWYAFFHCADLVGKDPVINKTSAVNNNKAVSDQKRGPIRRTNACPR